jgi:hypothetical protein
VQQAAAAVVRRTIDILAVREGTKRGKGTHVITEVGREPTSSYVVP